MDKNKQDQPEVTAATFKKADGTEETGKGRGPSIGKKEIMFALRNKKKKR